MYYSLKLVPDDPYKVLCCTSQLNGLTITHCSVYLLGFPFTDPDLLYNLHHYCYSSGNGLTDFTCCFETL